jgi:Na+/H+ antiporter NhaD/arsenite permease-like protein
VVALLLFFATYLVLAIGHLPGFRVDRTGAAVIGASLMVASGVLSLEEAYRAINFETIALLFGMMVVVANLRLSGFFQWVSERVVEHARHPLTLLAGVVGVSGLFSAFFVNDTVCLAMAPLVLEITRSLGRRPVPYLLALAMASNAGSVATITGNPQNMMIGSFSGIPYRDFTAALAPVAVASLVLTVLVLAVVYRGEFARRARLEVARRPVVVHRWLMAKTLTLAAVMLVLLFAGMPAPKVALLGGAVLLLTRRVKPERIYREVDWPLLALFGGLFVVVAGVEKTSLDQQLLAFSQRFHLERPGVLAAWTAVLSNLVSNVPAVLVFKPLVAHLGEPRRVWLLLAMASTLAGNLTVLGSVANLIVVQRARREAPISFFEYLKSGLPLTVLTLLVGVLWL